MGKLCVVFRQHLVIKQRWKEKLRGKFSPSCQHPNIFQRIHMLTILKVNIPMCTTTSVRHVSVRPRPHETMEMEPLFSFFDHGSEKGGTAKFQNVGCISFQNQTACERERFMNAEEFHATSFAPTATRDQRLRRLHTVSRWRQFRLQPH